MGLVDTSYQPWTGAFQPRPFRIAALVRTGLRLAFDGVLTKIVLITTYTVVVVFLGILSLIASSRRPLPLALGNNLYREYLNSWPYGMLLMLLAAMVGARLISRDLKFNAMSMYFSKGITRYDYLLGKFTIISLFLLSASLVPSVLLWLGQVAMGQEVITWGQRFRDLQALTLHSLIIVVPSSAVILALSSISRTAYVPGILYFLLYFGSWLVGRILQERVKEDWCSLVPWQNLTSHLGNLLYEVRVMRIPFTGEVFSSPPVMSYGWEWPALILSLMTGLSFAVVLFRLRKFEAQE